jgi:ABC-2 type transport system permease protein
MDKVLAVARREFLATVRTKAFMLSALMMPLIIAISVLGTTKVQALAKQEVMPTRRIAVLDETGVVYPEFTAQVAKWNEARPNQRFETEAAPAGADLTALRARVRPEELYACLEIPPDVVDGDGQAQLMRRDSHLETGRRLADMLNEAVTAVRLQERGLDPLELAVLRRPVTLVSIDPQTGQQVKSNETARYLMPFAFMFLLFMGTFGISQGLLTSLIEEKGSRVIEVLLSAVSPTQLMAGKILGAVLVGAVLLGLWSACGYYGAHRYHAEELLSAYRLGIATLYFVPGFLLISAILAAIGSACNELKDAQSMVFPLSLLTLIPMLFWFYIVESPNSAISLALSFVPPITPFIMILRICADPDTPVWQIAASLVLLWASVLLAIWAAGKVFRVGILMYGKPPSPRELLRWVRYS